MAFTNFSFLLLTILLWCVATTNRLCNQIIIIFFDAIWTYLQPNFFRACNQTVTSTPLSFFLSLSSLSLSTLSLITLPPLFFFCCRLFLFCTNKLPFKSTSSSSKGIGSRLPSHVDVRPTKQHEPSFPAPLSPKHQ